MESSEGKPLLDLLSRPIVKASASNTVSLGTCASSKDCNAFPSRTKLGRIRLRIERRGHEDVGDQ
jgi:hypothetical protein